MNTTLTIRCDCGSEHVDIDLYLDMDDESFISFSSKFTGPHRLWRERFRAVWLILRGKSYYFDELILDRDKLTQLRDFLIENLDDGVSHPALVGLFAGESQIPEHVHEWENILNDVAEGQMCFVVVQGRQCGAIR